MTDEAKWGCDPEDKQRIIEFALDLEENEEQMAEGAAMAVTCEQYGISVEEGWDWLICLPNSPYPWWIDDARLSDAEREKKRQEYEAREAS